MKREIFLIAASALLVAGCASQPAAKSAATSSTLPVENSTALAGPTWSDPLAVAPSAGPAQALTPAGDNGADPTTQAAPTASPQGAQAVVGEYGADGRAPVELAASPVATGAIGALDDQNAPRVVGSWTSYRDYSFSYNDASIATADLDKTAGIASYMRDHPSQQLGLDGTMDPNGTDPKDQELSDRRVAAVRTNLVDAGVPASRIKVGTFGDPAARRDRRVEVLFSNAE